MRGILLGLGTLACLTAAAAPGQTRRFGLPGWVELELVEVGGRTRLPLRYLYSRERPEERLEVSSPTYWIGRFEVTRKQYEAVMGARPGLTGAEDDRLPVTDVTWKEAVAFCDRLNDVARGEIPPGYRFDLPTIVEWAHAFEGGTTNSFRYAGSDDLGSVAWHGVEETANGIRSDVLHLPGLKKPNAVGAYDMSGNAAEWVFVADARGGGIRMGGSVLWPERYCELRGTAGVVKGGAFPDLGFRVALVPVGAKDPSGRSSAMGTKGRILQHVGCSALARRYLSVARSLKDLSQGEAAALDDARAKAEKACGYEGGTWSGLLEGLGARLASFGYTVEDALWFWKASPASPGYAPLRASLCAHYRRRGVFGMTVEARDLPKEVVAQFAPGAYGRVQAVSCDFTGDGLKDLVVELAGQATEEGDRYGFFARRREGGYVLVGEPIRAVGLCVMTEDESPASFLVLFRQEEDVVTPGVIRCVCDESGATALNVAWPTERPFALHDLEAAGNEGVLSFLGAWTPEKARRLAEGTHRRALCWPWK